MTAMAFEHYIYAGAKRLRCGYTTGSCAALAAKAAAAMLLTGQALSSQTILTPSGIRVEADILEVELTPQSARCSVRKDAGDDIDATNGILICAEVFRCHRPGLYLQGGLGVGRVTKPGLEQPVGEAAINSIPRQMILGEVEAVCLEQGYTGGMTIVISVPEGETIAQKTFNPNLGIEGGISILGTTGIVEPRSLTALLDSIQLEIRQQAALGHRRLIVTPGHYGLEYIKSIPSLSRIPVVSCANFIGDALDFAARYEYTQLLLVGHIGKLVKVAGGIMNTHSRIADCRTEIICAHAAAAGVDQDTAQRLLEAATTDACIDLLKAVGKWEPVMEGLEEAIGRHLERRVAGAYQIGAVLYSNRHGPLGQTPGTDGILGIWEEEE